MTKTVPKRPDGPYPHSLLCGQLGTAPNNKRIKTIISIRPIILSLSKRLYRSNFIVGVDDVTRSLYQCKPRTETLMSLKSIHYADKNSQLNRAFILLTGLRSCTIAGDRINADFIKDRDKRCLRRSMNTNCRCWLPPLCMCLQ